ncbi:MAG: T9SS type A sorting domain-containing protein [Bacteroidota bacterium]
MASQTIDFTVKCNISIENNFGNGIIKVEGSDQNSGIKVKKFIGENISVGAIDQNDGTFNRVWVSSGLNPSKWMRRLYNLNSEPIPGTNTRDYNYTVQGNEGGGAIIADLLRVYNVTFSNQLTDAPSNGVIIMGGTEYSSPLSAPCPERNGVAVEAKSYYYFGGSMEYIFDHWSNGATTTGTTGNAVNPQNSYVAVYKQRPRFYQDTRNLTFPSGAGGLRLQWNEHPNPGVTKYQIWRQIHSVDGRKITEPQELIATVNRGTTTYQDYSYTKNRYGVEYQIWYDVRAYFAPDTTISIPDAELTTAYWLGMDKKGSEQEKAMVVEDYAIDNYPNPFNPSTTIRYAVKEDGLVTLKVYDILGKEISTLVNETKTKGIYTVSFGGSDLPSGIYFYSISVNDYTATKKMMLTK